MLAIGELSADKLPKTPSRKAPPGGVARGAERSVVRRGSGRHRCCADWRTRGGCAWRVVGTLGGYEIRSRLVKAIGGKDLPIALLEDAIAVGGAILIVSQF